jgi:hypothetical protein
MIAVVSRERADVKPLLTALAWAVGAVSLAAFAAAWVLAARNRDLLDISAGFSPDRFMVAYPVAGALLASRRRSNPIGWFLLGVGVVAATRALAGEYALHALAVPPHPRLAVWAAWFVGWSLTLLFPGGLLTFLLLLFPGGRPLTARWWAVGWVAAGLAAISVVLIWVDPGTITVDGLPSVSNPTGLRGSFRIPLTGPFGGGTWVFGGVCLLLAAASLFVRYRRSAGEERLQLKWFAYVAILSLGLLVALLPFASTSKRGDEAFDSTIVAGIGLALPVAIGIAILKYRLYAIDRIISRTVSYALVTGAVAGVYLGCIAVLTKLLPGQPRHRGRSAGCCCAVQPAAPAGTGPGRPAVRPGPLQRRAGGRAVFRSAARRGRSRCAGRRPARRGASRPGPDATRAMAKRHRRPIDRARR